VTDLLITHTSVLPSRSKGIAMNKPELVNMNAGNSVDGVAAADEGRKP
jgi:hypothetical protein